MTWVDVVIVLLLAVMMLKGFVKGLVREGCELAGIVFAVFYAAVYSLTARTYYRIVS